LNGQIEVRRGGLGVLAVVRYADSDVGPYDELLWLAPWGLRDGARRAHTVTRIFVSSEASCINGRRNWGIPKQLARFDVARLSASTQRFEVSTPRGRVASFSVATGRRSTPIDTRVLPSALRRLRQVQDATSFEVAPNVRGRLHAARFSERVTDPEQFADTRSARMLGGVCISEFEMTFPVATTRTLREP
jgi:acetoacetate decarboxylase